MNHLGNTSTSPIAKDWYSFLCACKVVEDSGKVGKPKGCFTGTSSAEAAGRLRISSLVQRRGREYELVVHWMVNNGTIRTICIDLSSLSDMC